MSELTILNNLRPGWEEFQGHYRGTWFDPPSYLPWLEANPEMAEARERGREAMAIAKQVCEPRDLWKQNEVDAISYMFLQILNVIDASKPSPNQNNR